MKTTRHGGRRDQAARAALQPLVDSGTAVCWRCHQPIAPTDDWDAGHLEDLALGGKADGPRMPEHRACNRRAGAILGNQLPNRRRRATRLRDWLARFFERAASGRLHSLPFLSPKKSYGTLTRTTPIPPHAYQGAPMKRLTAAAALAMAIATGCSTSELEADIEHYAEVLCGAAAQQTEQGFLDYMADNMDRDRQDRVHEAGALDRVYDREKELCGEGE